MDWGGVALVIGAILGAGGVGAVVTRYFTGRVSLRQAEVVAEQTRAAIEKTKRETEAAIEKARQETAAAIEQAQAEAERKARHDVIQEWQEYATKLETAQIEERARHEIQRKEDRQEMMGLRKQVHELRDKYNASILEMTVKHSRCEQENVRLNGELLLVQATVNRLQAITGDVTGPTMPGLIIADTDGMIVDASPSIFPILGWLREELYGQNVEILIPERFREKHSTALARTAATGELPWTEKVIHTFANTKDGGEIPVTVTLAGRISRGQLFIAAEIKKRQVVVGKAGKT